MKRFIVDRFEEDFVVLEKEEGGTTDIKNSLLPKVQKGDIVIEKNGIYFVDKDATEKRRVAMSKKLKNVFGKK